MSSDFSENNRRYQEAEALAKQKYTEEGSKLQEYLTEQELQKTEGIGSSSIDDFFNYPLFADLKLPNSPSVGSDAVQALNQKNIQEQTHAWLTGISQNTSLRTIPEITSDTSFGRHEVSRIENALASVTELRKVSSDGVTLPQNKLLAEQVYLNYSLLLQEIQRLERLDTPKALYEARVIETTLSRATQILHPNSANESLGAKPQTTSLFDKVKVGVKSLVTKVQSWFSKKPKS